MTYPEPLQLTRLSPYLHYWQYPHFPIINRKRCLAQGEDIGPVSKLGIPEGTIVTIISCHVAKSCRNSGVQPITKQNREGTIVLIICIDIGVSSFGPGQRSSHLSGTKRPAIEQYSIVGITRNGRAADGESSQGRTIITYPVIPAQPVEVIVDTLDLPPGAWLGSRRPCILSGPVGGTRS